ncbi:cell division protein SepF [Modestobacter sp. NPDC049651]|uniref:cell division protein SepF n=1 Tax=unclassified Modestobacter TaxID=2643866 RepID=UPI0033F1ED66
MAGAMRRMGVYLGLVEEDETRAGYDRYSARQADHFGDYDAEYDGGHFDEAPDDRGWDRDRPRERVREHAYERNHVRRYDRFDDDDLRDDARRDVRSADLRGADHRGAELRGDRYGAGYDAPAEDRFEPADDLPADPEPLARRASARPLGLAGVGNGAGAAGATGLTALREPVAAAPAPVAPAPAPAAAPVKAAAREPYRITTVHPKSYNEARTIGERFRDGSPVIMNLSEMDHADAKRLVDFAIGLIFGLHGSIERVTAKVFLLSPQDVDVTAEDKARILEGGFSDQP